MTDVHESVGYLTWEQFERLRYAVNDSRALVPWLRIAGYIRGGDTDELRHRSSDRPLGLPPTWLAAEEITRLLNELNQYHELEDAANDEYGAWVAQELTREVGTAAHKWPLEDRPHNIRHLRCVACAMLTLRYQPPRTGGETVTVSCRSCNHRMDEQGFAAAVALVEAEANERRLGDRRGSRRKDAAVEADDLPVGIGWESADYEARAGAVA